MPIVSCHVNICLPSGGKQCITCLLPLLWQVFDVQKVLGSSVVTASPDAEPASSAEPFKAPHEFILHPVGGVLNYVRRGKQEVRVEDVPQQSISLTLGEVAFTLAQVSLPPASGTGLLHLAACLRELDEAAPPQPELLTETSCSVRTQDPSILRSSPQVQYVDTVKFVDSVSLHRKCLQVAHLRPSVTVSVDPAAWWRFALEGVCHFTIQQRDTRSGP